MQLRRGNQPKKNTNMPEYEIKTYGSNTGANRSPKISNSNRYGKQSIGRQDNANESYGELPYMEQGEGISPLSHLQNQKLEHNQNYNLRSPLKYSGNKENSNLNPEKKFPEKKRDYSIEMDLIDNQKEKIKSEEKVLDDFDEKELLCNINKGKDNLKDDEDNKSNTSQSI